jgi:hypothetical protein
MKQALQTVVRYKGVGKGRGIAMVLTIYYQFHSQMRHECQSAL